MTDQITNIDQALRDLPQQKPPEPVWDNIVAQLDRDEQKSSRRSLWLWGSVAASVIGLNLLLLFGQSQVEDIDLAQLGNFPSVGIYSTTEQLREATLLRQIAQLDRLLPYGTLDEQLEMYEYRNELSDRLTEVRYTLPGNQIRL